MAKATERGFYLISKDEVETPLNGGDFFVHDPEGLGLSLNNTITQLNGTFYRSASSYSLGEIKLPIIFNNEDYYTATRNSYENFKYLTRQLAGGVVTLKYTVPGEEAYFRDVALKSISKTDLDEYGVLQEELIFEPLTFWYQYQKFVFSFDGTADKTVTLDLDAFNILPIYYRNEIEIFDIEQSFNFPYWLCSHDNTHPGKDGYNITLDVGDKLTVGNISDHISAKHYDASADNTIDILHLQMPMCKAPLCLVDGVNSLTFKANGGAAYKCYVTVKLEYPLV